MHLHAPPQWELQGDLLYLGFAPCFCSSVSALDAGGGLCTLRRDPTSQPQHRCFCAAILPSLLWWGEALPSLLQLLRFSDSCLLSVWPMQISSC